MFFYCIFLCDCPYVFQICCANNKTIKWNNFVRQKKNKQPLFIYEQNKKKNEWLFCFCNEEINHHGLFVKLRVWWPTCLPPPRYCSEQMNCLLKLQHQTLSYILTSFRILTSNSGTQRCLFLSNTHCSSSRSRRKMQIRSFICIMMPFITWSTYYTNKGGGAWRRIYQSLFVSNEYKRLYILSFIILARN